MRSPLSTADVRDGEPSSRRETSRCPVTWRILGPFGGCQVSPISASLRAIIDDLYLKILGRVATARERMRGSTRGSLRTHLGRQGWGRSGRGGASGLGTDSLFGAQRKRHVQRGGWCQQQEDHFEGASHAVW